MTQGQVFYLFLIPFNA
uniref:Uncharacterized protein n=1 Tax=Moniliophthora roreri TaxID=221103 RepID=A0A0W0FHG8_MONRR